MGTTGWISEEPGAGPALPVTEMLLANREPQPGAVLEQALARSRAADAREAAEQAASARDADDFAAALVVRGYQPGQISQLSMKLADTMAELADEENKIEKTAKRSERLHREHAAGRISVFDIARAMGEADDDDEGDPGRVRLLTRRAESLRRQIGEAQEAVSQPQRYESDDGVEAASRRAHQAFREVTRQRMAEAQASRPEPRPFASVSRGAGRSTEHVPGGDCWVCSAGRRSETAGRDQERPYNEFGGPAITRAVEGGIVSVR